MTPITDTTRPRGSRARRLLTGAVVALGLLGVTPVAPAGAAEPTPAEFAAMGRTSAPSYDLPPGCHWYSYAYRIAPPEPEWSLEIFISDAAGVAQASEVMLSGADATSGSKRFQLCASNTAAPGLFSIRGRLTYRHYASSLFDQTQDYSGWITTSRFRVTKPEAPSTSPRCRKARQKAKRVHTAKARRAAHRVCRHR